MEISGKVVVVTGAGNGMGLAIARAFLQRGARGVMCADIDAAAAEAAASAVGGLAAQCDVGDESAIEALVADTEARLGPIDIFCSHAGFGDTNATGLDLPTAEFRRMLDVNLLAHVWAARAVVPGMVERGSGYLLQTLSATALITGPSGPGYTFTKHGALGFAEWLAINYAQHGIGVSCLCPNAVFTGGFGATPAQVLHDDNPPEGIGFGEIALASDVAELVMNGITDERFLILPHPRVGDSFRRKGEDYDMWLAGTRRRLDIPRPIEMFEQQALDRMTTTGEQH